MKKVDIKVGEEYAVGRDRYPSRAKCVEVGTFEARVYRGSRDFRGSITTKHGAKMLYLDAFPAHPNPGWVDLNKVLRTWDDEVVFQAAKAERAATELEARASASLIGDELEASLRAAGFGTATKRWGGECHVTIQLSPTDARELARQWKETS